MINGFKGKRILFISARFFGYEEEIKKKLISFGSEVDFFDERPRNDVLTKTLIRINRNLLAKKNSEYYNKIIKDTKDRDYDVIFIIKGEVISISDLKKLKRLHGKAKFILYMWDALSYTPNSKRIKSLFDHVFTFDIHDAQVYKDMKFRPLFYIDDYKRVAGTTEEGDIEALFVGTVHTDRFSILKKLEARLSSISVSHYFYMFYPSKILFYVKKYFNRDLWKYGEKELKFKALSKKEVLTLFSRARVIVDIERPRQNGLTIRTIEVFGAKKKLITTNQAIKDYDFYHPNNILIIDRENPVIHPEFFKKEYKEAPISVYEKYSIDHWLFELFEESIDQSGNKALSIVN